MAAFLTDWHSAHWPSEALLYSCTDHCQPIEIHISCWNSSFAHNRSVYQPILTCDCSQFCQKNSLHKILAQATYWTWWKHIDPFCPTFSWFPSSFSSPLRWKLQSPVQPSSLTTVVAESIREHLVRHFHPAAPSFPEPWCYCLAQY